MLQKIRRRDIILLSGALSLACFTLITVALLILRTQPVISSSAVGPNGVPAPQPTHTVTYVEITGLSRYGLAEVAAKAWAADAQLVSINAGWPEILRVDQVGAPTTWRFRFYSSSKARQLFVTVDLDNQVRTVEHVVKVTLPPRLVQLESWAIDSPAAMAIWLDYGGSELLRTNPGLELAVQLRAVSNNPNPIWVVIGADKRTGDIHIVAIDAGVGAVVSTSPGL